MQRKRVQSLLLRTAGDILVRSAPTSFFSITFICTLSAGMVKRYPMLPLKPAMPELVYILILPKLML